MSSKSKERGFMWNDFFLNGIGRRLGVLVVVALIGGKVLAHLLASNWWFCWFPVGTHEVLAHIVSAAPFTVPTFVALWWFRTYDSRQQLQRANFEAGVGHIASDTPIRIEIGTQILVEVSRVTSAFDSEIALTFIKRLKRFPDTSEKNTAILRGGYNWGYAQHMLKWLLKDYRRRNKPHDLNRVELRYQEFADTTAKITICEMLEMHKDNLLTVDVAGCNSSLSNFLGQCPSACAQWDAKNDDKNRLTEKSKVLPSLRIMVSHEECNLDSK